MSNHNAEEAASEKSGRELHSESLTSGPSGVRVGQISIPHRELGFVEGTTQKAAPTFNNRPLRKAVIGEAGAGRIANGRHPEHSLATRLAELARIRQTVQMATEEDVRRIALSLPSTSEKPSYGTPGFRVKDKLFARIRDGGELGVYCESEDEKFAMVAAEPAKFFTTSHFDGYAMVLVNLDAVDPEELTELLTEAWLLRAPVKLRAEFEAR